jgi:hypothetical protein
MRVWFSAQPFSETFIVRRIERGIIINEHMYSCKTFVIIVRFVLKLDILNRFLKNNKVLIFKISVQWETSCSMRTNEPTDTQQDEPNNRFTKICEVA